MLDQPEIFAQYTYLIIILAVWDLAWKGMALWRAAKNDSKPWFVAILIINSVGIIPIIYLIYNWSVEKKIRIQNNH